MTRTSSSSRPHPLRDELPPLPPQLISVLERLRVAGLDAFLVGGAVRDLLLEREARDFDVLVPAGLEAAQRVLPEAIRIEAHSPVLSLAEARHDAPVRDRIRVELSGLRAGASRVEEDLRLRDFTLNAIGFEPAHHRWLDPLGGRADLAARRLRAADPERAFRDDGVRILRGARLEAELGLELEPDTQLAMERDLTALARAAGERVRDELLRTLELDDPTGPLERLRRCGALAWVLPELLRGVGVAQNRHHPDDVHRHTLRVCALCPTRPLLRLAALLHDAAKPETKTRHPRRDDFRFLRHEHLAARHVAAAAERLRLSRRDASRVGRLVRHHLIFPARLASDAAVRRLVRRVGRDILADLLALRRADLASRRADEAGAEWNAAETRIRAYALALEAGGGEPLAITGKTIMRELGVAEGPQVGRLLARARRRVVEHPGDNERERLLAWLRASLESERPVARES